MTLAKNDVLIVGAGLTGLNLARRLTLAHPKQNVLILEKSKACGGRMATRRIGLSKFDHGAQFIKNTEASRDLLAFWRHENVLKNFPSSDFAASCGPTGMTQLAKKIAENINISYECKVARIEKISEGWKIISERGENYSAENIILTCPLPQALEILKLSQIPFDQDLSQIIYSKAIVQLVQFDSGLVSEMNYLENVDHDIFSICSQQTKGLSARPEYTIVMQKEWSDLHFDKSDDEILHLAKEILRKKFAAWDILNIQIKKWKFCQPTQVWHKTFEMPAPGLYLAGDAFGGASLNGALRSSDSLAEKLIGK